MESIEILSGISLNMIHSVKFKSTNICILIRQPLVREFATMNALLPMVLQRGCSKYGSLPKINEFTEKLYGSVFECQIMKKGEQQIILIFMEIVNVAKENLVLKALEFLKEIMLRPLIEGAGFKKEYVDGEKQNLAAAIKGRINNKTEYAKLRCLEEMCINEPFGLYGDGYIEDLDSITPELLYQHYSHLLKTAPIDFVIMGNENMDVIRQHTAKLFQFERGSVTPIPTEPSNYEGKPGLVTEYAQMAQSKLCVGIRSGILPVGREVYELMVLNEVLGGGANSKLFVNLREKEHLCYDIYSLMYRFKGIILIQCGLDAGNFEKTVQLIKKELGNLTNAEDVQSAKTSLLAKLKGIQDYPAAVMDFYVSQKMLGDPDSIEEAMDRIKEVDANKLEPLAKRLTISTIYQLTKEG